MENENIESYTSLFFCYNTMFVLTIGLVYLFCGVPFLIQDYNKWNDCNGSALFPYVILKFFLIINKLNLSRFKINKENLKCFILNFIIEIVFFVWGINECFEKCNNCYDLKHSKLRCFTIIILFFDGLSICLFIVIIIYLINLSNNKVHNINIDNIDNNINNDNIC